MKTTRLTDIRKIELGQATEPGVISDTDVLIRVGVVGVCGSDIHYYEWGRIGDQVIDFPFTIGHEFAGTVEKTGGGVTRVKPGDRIAVDPSVACGQCDQCQQGRPHTCRNNKFLGCPGQLSGSLTEKIVMPEENCFPLPNDLTLEEGALSEPLSIGLYAVKQSQLQKGMNIGILGYGPIGMSVHLAAQAYGVGKAYVSDKLEPRLEMARKEGATATANPEREDVVGRFNEAEPSQLDVVYECCGDQEALDQAIDLVKPGGSILIVGIPPMDRWGFDVNKGRRKEVSLINVRRQNGTVQETLDLMASGRIQAQSMVTHRFTLDQTPEAFELVANYRDGVMKAMVQNHQ